MSVSIMPHNISKKKFFSIFKKNMVMKEIVDYYYCEKIVSKASFILREQPAMYQHHQNFSLT